mmetsp:Transcript_30736/g.69041  ORF Transcript_30736/g.69041 Transcript_30736/m.69041 type:complete len:453 (+) Transcript_30736:67-1425(+)
MVRVAALPPACDLRAGKQLARLGNAKRRYPSMLVEVLLRNELLVRPSGLLHGEALVFVGRVHGIVEVNVVEICVIAQVAVDAAEQADVNLVESELEAVHHSRKLVPRDVAPPGSVHVHECRLQEHTLGPHPLPDLVLHPADQIHPLRGHAHLVPPGGQCAGRIWHASHRQGVLLEVWYGKGSIAVCDEVLVTEKTVIPHVGDAELLELGFVDILSKAHEGEDSLHLAASAVTLPQGVEVLEVLEEPSALLNDLCTNLLHRAQAMLAPLCVIGLQKQVAPRIRRHVMVHHRCDIVVERLEVHIPGLSRVVLGQTLHILLRELLLERPEPDELTPGHLATTSRVHPGGRGDGRTVQVCIDVLHDHTACLAEGRNAVEQVICLRLLVYAFRHECHQLRAAGRGRYHGARPSGVEDLVDGLAELHIVEDRGLLHLGAHLLEVLCKDFDLMLLHLQA